jgi:hypothetical protein
MEPKTVTVRAGADRPGPPKKALSRKSTFSCQEPKAVVEKPRFAGRKESKREEMTAKARDVCFHCGGFCFRCAWLGPRGSAASRSPRSRPDAGSAKSRCALARAGCRKVIVGEHVNLGLTSRRPPDKSVLPKCRRSRRFGDVADSVGVCPRIGLLSPAFRQAGRGACDEELTQMRRRHRRRRRLDSLSSRF